ncbi:ankyrin [Wilcoxina mikolae CBS 423.85]|nr:ankyrin [Wilcoxina mikolae CBS 423.85]
MRPPPPPTPPQQPIPPLLLLPADLLLSIASHLPPHSLLSLLLTSRHLHRFLLPAYHRLSASFPSALLHAAPPPSPALLTHLLAHGANPNTPDPHGLTPLDHASRLGHNSIISTLLSFHAVLEIHKGTRQPYPLFSPLDLASKSGHTTTVSLLLSSLHLRYPPNQVTDAIGRALLHAVSERRTQTCQWILDHTTPPRERLQEALAKAVTLNSPNIARILLASGADPNAITPDQPTTLLHRAAERNRVALVELLLEYGAAVDVRDGVGLMPLHYAVKGCAGEALEALLLAGCGE